MSVSRSTEKRKKSKHATRREEEKSQRSSLDRRVGKTDSQTPRPASSSFFA